MMKYACPVVFVSLWLGCCGLTWAASPTDSGEDGGATTIKLTIPTLSTDNGTVNEAFRIAVGDLLGNVAPFKDGLLKKPVPVILAGLNYNAYVTVEKMAVELKAPVDPLWKTKATRLKGAINARLWNGEKGNYRCLVGPFGNCDLQEGLAITLSDR